MGKSPKARRPRPSRALGLLSIAMALGGIAMVVRPAPGGPAWSPAFGRPPLATPPGPRIATAPGTLPPIPLATVEVTGPVDRCLIPAPQVDDRFAVAAPQVDDRFAVAPLVRGLPVSSREAGPQR